MNDTMRRVKCVVKIEYYVDVEVPLDCNSEKKQETFLKNAKRKLATFLLKHISGHARVAGLEVDPEVPMSIYKKYGSAGIPEIPLSKYYKEEVEVMVEHHDIREPNVSKYS